MSDDDLDRPTDEIAIELGVDRAAIAVSPRVRLGSPNVGMLYIS